MHAVASSSSLAAAAPVCRICWESTCEANGSDEFLRPTPCSCRDERSNVHQDCLECVPERTPHPPRENRVNKRLPPPASSSRAIARGAASAPRAKPTPSASRPPAPPPPTPPTPLTPPSPSLAPLPSPSRRWILEARSQGRFDAGTICHACGDRYDHPALARTVLSEASKAIRPAELSADHREPVALIGGTGYVGRSVALHLLDHPTFRLGAIVGSAATAGKPFSAVFEKKEEALVEHYGRDLWKPQDFPAELMSARVSSVEEVLELGECKTALSFIAPEHGEVEDTLAAAGVKVFSISPHARFDLANPLSVPEANPEVLREAVARSVEDPAAEALSLVKSPNCVTCGTVIALKALDDAFGVDEVSVTTFQSLSGRGDAKYPRDVVMGNVYPLHGTVERTGEYQTGELRRIMPGVSKVSVAAYRVPVQRGHLVDVRVRFKRPASAAGAGEYRRPTEREVAAAFERFDPLRDVPLPSKPRRAIYVKPLDEWGEVGEDGERERPPPRVGTPRPKDDCEFEGGMAISVGNIDATDECFDVKFCVVVNNVVRGAWGAALLNAEYWRYLEKVVRPAPRAEN